MVSISLGLGLEKIVTVVVNSRPEITGLSRQILIQRLPPQTQDLHGFFLRWKRPHRAMLRGLAIRQPVPTDKQHNFLVNDMNYMTTLRAAVSVRDFLFSDTVADLLSSIELEAAKDAFWKATLSTDWKARVDSGINHLETAEHALRSQVESMPLRHILNRKRHFNALSKKNYVHALMACAHHALDDLTPRNVCLERLIKNDRVLFEEARSLEKLGRYRDLSRPTVLGAIAGLFTKEVPHIGCVFCIRDYLQRGTTECANGT
ncbi:MAG: hypothetical protein KF851_16280 [Pirellulaceae bacterium]|nr:hypothetical protein [Pirellulaceae bacterium]